MQIARQNRPRKVLISLTPLVDIIFILLVFFMLASSFLDWRSVVLQTPAQARQQVVKPIKTLRISLTGQHGMQIDGQPVPADRLMGEIARIAATTDRLGALVIVQDDVPLQRGIDVLQQLTDAGITRARLAARPAKAAR